MKLRFWKHFNHNRDFYTSYRSEVQVLEYSPEIGSISDIGCSRSNNQDNIGILTFSGRKNLLAIVADGMGGHLGGEMASRIAVETVQKKFSEQIKKRDGFTALKNAFHEANDAIFRQAKQSPNLTGMGTTLVAMALWNGRAYYTNVGDSRLYRIRSGQCSQLSQDHTLVAEMVRTGLLAAEAANNHPDRHVVSRAIGTHPKVQVDVSESALAIQIGDGFLLCSDGLHDLVDEDEIMEVMAGNTAQQACNRLVELANFRGGYDNISIIIIKILKTPNVPNEVPVTRF